MAKTAAKPATPAKPQPAPATPVVPAANDLSFGNGNTGGIALRPGVYINKAKILKVKDISGKIAGDWQEKPFEIGIQLMLDIGKDFTPIMTMGGYFKRDATTNKIVDWGGAFPIRSLLDTLQIKGKLSGGKIPIEILQQMIGREILRLSYVKGIRKDNPEKLSYSDFNIVVDANQEKAQDILLSAWDRNRKKGYPKNYHPEAMAGSNGSATSAATSFDPSSFTEKEETPASTTPPVTTSATTDDDGWN